MSQRSPGALSKLGAFLVSPKLAIALLVIVLACCVVGVTVVRGVRAGELIFATLWFNALLVLLAISSASAFFSRFWRRKLTVVNAGMIVFHLSFLGVLGGVVYNGLFQFTGVLRLTEGETLPNDRLESYDDFQKGRFFDVRRLRGETTLLRMHRDYEAGGNKRAAYEIEVGEPGSKVRSIIYITEYLDHGGVRFFCMKEGYSVLLVLSEKNGPDLFGAFVPLQSYRQPDGSYRYGSGSAHSEGGFAFPPPPERPRADLLLGFRPNTVKDRDGEVTLKVWPIRSQAPVEHSGRVVIGAGFEVDDLVVTPREVRYWVGMNVRYDPGLNIILGSLTVGLAGMFLTFAGRIRQGKRRDA